jgi:hypothetical protein
MFLPGDAACGGCGKVLARRTLIETLPGQMVEIGSAKKQNKQATWDEKARFYGCAKLYANDHGYKDGWAANKYRDKYGVWPNDPRVSGALPAMDPASHSWIKSQIIRWAKSKQQAAA